MSIYLQCSLKLHKLLKLQCLPRNGQNVVRFEFFCFSIPYRCENKSNRWACPPLAMMYHAVQSLKIEMDFFKQYYVKKFIYSQKKKLVHSPDIRTKILKSIFLKSKLFSFGLKGLIPMYTL